MKHSPSKNDLPRAEGSGKATRKRRTLAWLAGLGILVLVAFGLYLQLGNQAARQQGLAMPSPTSEQTTQSVGDFLAGIGKDVFKQLDETQRWVERGQAHVAEQRFAEAVTAFQRAYRFAGDQPDLLVDYAEALALAHGNRLSGEPRRLLNRALQLAPNHTKGLWLSGIAAYQGEDNEQAIAYWQRILERGELVEEERKRLEEHIATARARLAVGSASDLASSVRLQVRVALDPTLASEVSPKSMNRTKQQIVIVGAGINGLIAASYLQRGGCQVTLIKRAAQVGGACVSAVAEIGGVRQSYAWGHQCLD